MLALLELGADPFPSCNGDETLIKIAVRQGDIAVVNVLLESFEKRDLFSELAKNSVKRALQSSRSLKMLKMESVLSR